MKQKKIHIIVSYKYIYSYIFLNFYIFIFFIPYSIESGCSEELPFYDKIYNYCVNYCSYRNLLSGLCIPNSEINSSIEITLKIIDELIRNSTLNINNYEYTITGDNIIYQITSTKLLKQYSNENNAYANSYLNLGECDKNIRIKNSISLDIPLIIILINIYNTSYITKYDKGFLIYDPINKKKNRFIRFM